MPPTPTTDRPRSSAALAFLVAGGVWFLVAALYGLAGAIHLMAPEFFNNIPWLVFGRTRPAHVNTMLFGFVAGTLIGAMLHYVPALLRAKLWSPRLAWVSFWLWQAAVLSGPLTFAFGVTQAREYAEYIWPVDVCVVAAVGTLIVNLLMTLARRRESGLYVSVWYAVGAMLWTAALYPIGNVMWRPQTGAVPGILDSIILWFYGHNVVGLLLTPLALAAVYFIVPRITKTPLYSHTLSLIGFFSLAAIYSHIGGHHILQAPIPNWLRTLSIVDSVAMIVPVTVVLVNVWMTARGRLGMLWNDPAGRFILVGTFWYLITCVQGPIQSLPSVQAVTHFTNWTIGHAHVAVLGFAGFIAIGAAWHVVPNLTGRQIYSRRLISLQFGLAMFGLVGFFLVLTAAGLVQGHAWQRGETVYRALPVIGPYMILRAMLGISIIASAGVCFHNLVMTIRHGEPIERTVALEERA